MEAVKKSKNLRIAMIGHKRIPSREGGVEVVVEELATRMVAQGCDVTVYNRGGHHVSGKENDTNVKKQKEYKGIHIVTVPTPNRKSLNAIVAAVLSTLHAVCHHFDVIHYHAEGSCAVLWLPHLLGIKTVVTIHGLDWQRSKWGGFATKFLLFGEKVAAKYADEIIVLSKNVAQYFKDTYNRDTVFVPNGITIPEQREADIIVREYGLQKNGYLLFLARIVPEKGLHYLLEAYEKLSTDMPLVIAGGSSHTDAYLEQIRQRVEKNPKIIMTGFVQGRRLEELYSNCCLYILPSDIEGMPISLLEALSYGRACLCSDILENKETAGKYATYFNKGNVENLAEQLCMQLRPDVMQGLIREECCTERQTYVKNSYDWKCIVEQTIQIYRKVL